MAQENQKDFNLEEVLDWLKESKYKVSRPFTPRTSYSDETPPGKLLKAAIVDTETTGVIHFIDKIIELGIVVVEYSPQTGQFYRVLETFNELEYPGMPIPPESTKIHGITNDMVANKKIDDQAVEKLMTDVSLVIAHNSFFDRGFMEERLPIFKDKAWACSYAQIPWKAEGVGSASLEFLAYRSGFHFSGHRASVDCHALLEVLQTALPVSGDKAMKALLEKARIPEIKVWALNAPFDNKDKLKERSYRWNGDRKLWSGFVSKADLPIEVDWLRVEVYDNRKFKLELEQIDAFNRFTLRPGEIEVKSYE
ncbi:MAG: DNA polymerase-3 subunit epsilon [Methylophilaceae bacterium]|jgi:DNA polymerase-3 subunit epsilon